MRVTCNSNIYGTTVRLKWALNEFSIHITIYMSEFENPLLLFTGMNVEECRKIWQYTKGTSKNYTLNAHNRTGRSVRCSVVGNNQRTFGLMCIVSQIAFLLTQPRCAEKAVQLLIALETQSVLFVYQGQVLNVWHTFLKWWNMSHQVLGYWTPRIWLMIRLAISEEEWCFNITQSMVRTRYIW